MTRAMLIIGALLALFGAPLSASANTLTVTPNRDGTVMIAADGGVNGVALIELTFSYSTAFADPRVIIQGGDYSFEQMKRDSKPGFMKLEIAREGDEMLEAAFVLIVDFDTKPPDQPCPVSFVAATYTYADGRTASPGVTILPAIVAKEPVSLPDGILADSGGKSAKAAPAEPGERRALSERLKTPGAPARDEKPGENTGRRSSGHERQDEKDKPGVGEYLDTLEYRACPDPLQRFRDYRGDRKPTALLPLFAFVNPCGCRQTPPVAISDGTGKVALTIETDPASQNAPNFGVSGARFLSLRQDSEKSWTIELLPNRGEHDVVLYVVAGRVLKRIPLAVAAPLALLGRPTPEEALSPLLDYTIAVNSLAAHLATAPIDGP